METAPAEPKNTYLNLPAEKQARILRAAMEEFGRNGYEKASLNTMVRELAISKGSIYRYFANKEALFLFVFEQFTQLVKEVVHQAISGSSRSDFFSQVREVLLAGIRFIDQHPEYFQIYLQVLFEKNIPHREELISRVRLFSFEYFGPLCDEAKEQGTIRRDISTRTICFMIDSLMDRFLQAYARPYLDGGLELAGKSAEELAEAADLVIYALRQGMRGNGEGRI